MVCIPTFGLYLQSSKVQLQLVTVGIRITFQTTLIDGIKAVYRSHESIVTTTHHLVIDYHLLGEVDGCLAVARHTTHITTAVDGTEHGSIVFVVGRVAFSDGIECDAGHQSHSHTVHIGGKGFFVGEVHGVELRFVVRNIRSLHGAQHTFMKSLAFIILDHVGTIVAQEHIVGNHVGTNLQFHHRFSLDSRQRSTVTATIDRATNDGRMIRIRTRHTDRHLLGIRTEGIEGFRRVAARIIVEVAIDVVTYQLGIVGIRIGAVTSTIDITSNTGIYTYGITAIHTTCDIVTTIDIVDVTTTNQHTGRQACREFVNLITVFIMQLNVRRQDIKAVSHWTNICHTTSAIDIVHLDGAVSHNFQQQSLRVRHSTLITTAIEVSDLSVFQVPYWTNGHICHVVTTKESANLEGITAGIGQTGVDSHEFEALCSQQFALIL